MAEQQDQKKKKCQESDIQHMREKDAPATCYLKKMTPLDIKTVRQTRYFRYKVTAASLFAHRLLATPSAIDCLAQPHQV